jgi:galactose oxidase
MTTARPASPFRVLAENVPTPVEQDAAIQKREKHPPVVVGVTPTCPYGISACWGGAYEALSRLHGVRLVRPIPNADDSTAYVYLKHEGLPDLDLWPAQFAKVANGAHIYRGVEVTVEGVVEIHQGGALVMRGNEKRPPLLLDAIEATDKIQWDQTKLSIQPLETLEQNAYDRLLEQVKSAGGYSSAVVTGPLRKSENGNVLHVRQISVF